MPEEISATMVELATELTMAWLGNQNNRIAAEEVPAFLQAMHTTLSTMAKAGGVEDVAEILEPGVQFVPAVSVRKSLASRDHILSMIDGKPYRTLTRHLSSNGLTPAEYRQRYGLKPDYPMTAETYSEARREMAKKIGLGRKRVKPEIVKAVVKPKRARKTGTPPA